MGEGTVAGDDDAKQTRRYWMGVVHRDHVLRGGSCRPTTAQMGADTLTA